MDFGQSSELGYLNPDRTVTGLGVFADGVNAGSVDGEPLLHGAYVLGEGTRLGRILGRLELEVNSMHHQAIKTLGRGLREVAWAPDGIIEAAELEAPERFLLGVQWHPEELVRDAAACNLFAALVAEARARRRG